MIREGLKVYLMLYRSFYNYRTRYFLGLNFFVFQEVFATLQANYYYKTWFHIASGVHRILPENVDEVIMLDVDMLFLDDIQKLWAHFQQMNDSHLIGLAHEQQPVYYHVLTRYREQFPGTLVGKPLPHGNPGVNGGVKLFRLKSMREKSAGELYNSYLDIPGKIRRLADRYHFRGHLGDQDLYTLLCFKHPELFYTLPCQWNRQLCQWWKTEGGYADVFDAYSTCDPPYRILHGNCRTKINHTSYKSFTIYKNPESSVTEPD
jgi:Glycosyl transferase family 8.